MKKYISEFIGTFALVFCGTGAIIIDQQTGGGIGHIGIAATFGLIVMVMIYALGNISGAHFNPAVTIGFAASGTFSLRDIAPYISSQLLGAFAASALLYGLFPNSSDLGASLPAGSWVQTFVLEWWLTWLLMFVILRTAQGNLNQQNVAGMCIGATVLLAAMFAGKISGASMNPARSLAPAILSGNTDGWWLYVVAPIAGALSSVLVVRALK